MAYPFGAPSQSSEQGRFFARHQLKRLMSALLPQAKSFLPSTRRRKQPPKLQLEPLEPRLLLSADLAFVADPGGSDLTLRLDNVDTVDTLVIVDNVDNQIVASHALADLAEVRISGGIGADRLTVDQTNPFIVPIRFDDITEGDNDLLTLTGTSDAVWQVTGDNEGPDQ